jgi:hypothetical protein
MKQDQNEFDVWSRSYFWTSSGPPATIIITAAALGLASLVWVNLLLVIAAFLVTTLYLLVPYHRWKCRREMRRIWTQREGHLDELRQRALQDAAVVTEFRDFLRDTLRWAEDFELCGLDDNIPTRIPRLRLELKALDDQA